MMRLSLTGAMAALMLAGCATEPVSEDPLPMAEDLTELPDAAPEITPPVAERIPVTIEQLGRTRVDPYQWMKDPNWQDVMTDPSVLDPTIRAYLEAENAYTTALLEEPTADLRAELFEEMRGRIKEDDSSLPRVEGPWAYLTRYRTGGEYPIIARKPVADLYNEEAADEILLDGDVLGADKAYFGFGDIENSPDHAIIAYSYDDQGSEFYDIKFRNVETGEDLSDIVPQTNGSIEWAADSQTLYWVERDENSRPVAVHAYTLGGDGSVEVYREADPGMFVGLGKSASGDFIWIVSGNGTQSEWHFIPSDAPAGTAPTMIEPRSPDLLYDVAHWNGAFLISTNAGDAIDFKLVTAPIETPGQENWTDLVPHRPGTLILGMDALKDHLVRLERKDGLPQIVVIDRESGAESLISFDEAAYDLGAWAPFGYDTSLIRYSYDSPTTPYQIYDYDLAKAERILRKTREIPSGHNAEDYVAERIMAPAHDGETVPVTILRHKDTPVDGTAPLLLYGYGSYGYTIPADFRTSRLSLVDRGFIYAIAHIRGSRAKGFQWYLDGKLDKKENTFKDYISAGRHLVSEGYGYEGGVVGHGGSAGGLLMGAAANMDPELFAGIIAAVPFVDVINTISDDTLPLTPPEWPEWGNPITDPEAYDTILAYSPYDQVANRPYPEMLITGGLTDPRVTYWEPAKWAAALRHEAPEGGPYYLRINMEAGHGGASGRFEGLKETAIEYAFALRAVGLAD